MKLNLPPNGRRAKYPWRRWLKVGGVVTLVRGRDFAPSADDFAAQVRNWASRLRVSVSIEERENSLTVSIGGRLPPIVEDRCLA